MEWLTVYRAHETYSIDLELYITTELPSPTQGDNMPSVLTHPIFWDGAKHNQMGRIYIWELLSERPNISATEASSRVPLLPESSLEFPVSHKLISQHHLKSWTYSDKNEGVWISHSILPFWHLDHRELDWAGTSAHKVLDLGNGKQTILGQ